MKKNVGEKRPIKIILLGESGVGKTSIILRYSKNQFESHQGPTIGATFIEKDLTKNNIKYKLNIWDTTGQEQYHSVTKLFIQGADIIILVYSIDKKETFKLLDYWYKTITETCGDNIVLAIVGNKYDLFDDEKIQNEKVEDEEGQKFASEKNAIFKLVSAKLNKKGIDLLFEEVIVEFLKKNPNIDNIENNNLKIDDKKNKKKRKCC